MADDPTTDAIQRIAEFLEEARALKVENEALRARLRDLEPAHGTLRIYLASSWRNKYQADVLAELRATGAEVYDFKNPAPGNNGFGWSQCDPELKSDLTVERMRRVLAHPVAQAGFKCDFDAMKWANCGVLLLPSGMSAHLEAGWFAGSNKPVAVLAPEIREPELMYKMFDRADWFTPIFATVREVVVHLASTTRDASTVAYERVRALGDDWGTPDERRQRFYEYLAEETAKARTRA